MVKCNCRGCKFTKICSHSVAISEREDILQSHVAKVKRCRSRAVITYPLHGKGSGRKGGQRCRERSYKDKPFQEGNEITVNQSPFTKIWHSNCPLKILSVLTVPSSKNSCGHCGMNFQEVHFQLYHLALSLIIKNVDNISTDIGQQKTTRNTFRHQPIFPQHGTTVFEGTAFIIDFHILVLLSSLSQMMLC